MSTSGFVYIVGAGPGDPDLITVKGMRSLRQADVVLYDRLIDPRLLDEVRPGARTIDVGKRKGDEDAQQARIAALMVKHAQAGSIVCRLKGGDPFVFGRAAEEVEALQEAGIPFEVVPGLSSVTAGPTSAGISLTQRGRSHAFMVIAGSQSLGFQTEEWRAAKTLLEAGGTVVVLMGLARAHAISDWLLQHGVAPDLPAAVVSRATWSDQETRAGSLRTIGTEAESLGSPAILILGQSAIPLDQEVFSFANSARASRSTGRSGSGFLKKEKNFS